MGLHLAQTADVHVTGLTLSSEQHGYATRTAAAVGLQGSAEYHLRDYRHETDRYDRIVSVGMFEHVGIGHFQEYFDKVASLLTEDGVGLIHTIGTARGPTSANPWLHKYIFPGGYAPALSEVVPVIERAGLFITDVEVLRLHYAHTLSAWRSRFIAESPRIADLYDERFCRMWEFYLAYCEAAFRHSGLVVFQIQISKGRADHTRLHHCHRKSELAMTWITYIWIAILIGAGLIVFRLPEPRRGVGQKPDSDAPLVPPPDEEPTLRPPVTGRHHHGHDLRSRTIPPRLESALDMNSRMVRRPGCDFYRTSPALLAGLVLWAGFSEPTQAQDASNYQIVGSVAAYLGMIPAEIVGGHPATHPESRMHGGPPKSAHAEHIVIALFEDPSGARIENAKVEATLSGIGETAITPITLDPMPIAGVVTYGGYVLHPGPDTYTINLKITRPDSPTVTKMRFVYQHGRT